MRPDERAAQERTWEVVRRAFEAREPRPHARDLRPLVLVLAAGALVAAALSPPGQALLGDVSDAVRVDETEPALLSLPAPGRVLAVTRAGAWVVEEDGARRRLGDHGDAAWSPFGRYVVATDPNALAALEPDGETRWSLPRRNARLPAWGGTRVDTRIAFLIGSRLHVVAGDGDDDVDAGGLAAAAPVRPAWRPGARHVVSYVATNGRVHVYDTAGALEWRSPPLKDPLALQWSRDGGTLLAASRREVRLYSANGRLRSRVRYAGVVDAALSPRGDVALTLAGGRIVVGGRTLLSNVTGLGPIAWSPNGRWLLVTWPAADQWLFVRAVGPRRIESVSDISKQFGGAAQVVSWGPPAPADS